MSDSRDAWVIVRQSHDPIAIELARAALDNEKITSRQRNQMTAAILPLHQAAIGGFELEVRAKDEEAARACLTELDASVHDTSLDDEVDESETPPDEDTREGDAAMRRAAAAAVLGITICLGLGGVFALFVLAANSERPLSARGRTFRSFALLFSALGFVFAFVLWKMSRGEL